MDLIYRSIWAFKFGLWGGSRTGFVPAPSRFSRDLEQWTVHLEPLYKAGGHPGDLDT